MVSLLVAYLRRHLTISPQWAYPGAAAICVLLALIGVTIGITHAAQNPQSIFAKMRAYGVDAQLTGILSPTTQRQDVFDQAELLAAQYDYDGAIALIRTLDDGATNENAAARIAEYEAIKATLVPVDVTQVTHIFYHSLIVDAQQTFENYWYDSSLIGANQWLTTIDEFNMVTREMYDRGYVLVSIHDLVDQTTDSSGATTLKPGTILLPPGKKAFVLSIDDLSYYHNYSEYGVAEKLIVDDTGNVVCEFIQPDGSVVTGAYDVVPLLDRFIDAHPDAAYRGAKGIIALTGYNGVLGYRTDETYRYDHPELDGEQRAFLDAHPDFDLASERAQAKTVADVMKANGWEFASHTWGHLNAQTDGLDYLAADSKRWNENVAPIIGDTDVLIYAFGADVQPFGLYDKGEAKFAHYYNQGYRIFCGVTADSYRVQLGDDYLRMDRRNIDGYRIYFNSIGVVDDLWDLFDSSIILDPGRPPVADLVFSEPEKDDVE